jgi:hypothetical protein
MCEVAFLFSIHSSKFMSFIKVFKVPLKSTQKQHKSNKSEVNTTAWGGEGGDDKKHWGSNNKTLQDDAFSTAPMHETCLARKAAKMVVPQG